MLNKLIIIIAMIVLGSFIFGFVLGQAIAINVCVKVGTRIADVQIDPEIIKWALIKYGGRL